MTCKFTALIIGLLLSQLAFARQDYAEQTAEVKALRDSSAIRNSYHYCTLGTLTCRTLVLLMDPVTGVTKPDFYNNFLSSERAVASTGYFLRNSNGTYKNYLDQTFDGIVNIDFVTDENMNLVVTQDPSYFPTVHNMMLKRLGTTKYVVATMSFTAEMAKIVGWEYDATDVTYKKPVLTIYQRQHGNGRTGKL
ncbi:MAG: hypothetical protein AB7H97_12325 [Pseudobdellovibrionaceae bacterium]